MKHNFHRHVPAPQLILNQIRQPQLIFRTWDQWCRFLLEFLEFYVFLRAD